MCIRDRFKPGSLLLEVDGPAAVRIADDRRHALREQTARVAQLFTRETFERMRMRIDEAGRHVPIARVNGDRAGSVRQMTNRRDAVPGDADVDTQPRIAAAVEDTGVRDQDVERGFGLGGDAGCEEVN